MGNHCRLSEQHRQTFNTLDAALVEDGVTIAILWRVAPIAPYVLSSALLSLTSIARSTFLWTTLVGNVPSTLPILLSASAVGQVSSGGESDSGPLSMAVNAISIVAAILVAFKLGRIAVHTLGRHGFAALHADEVEKVQAEPEECANESAGQDSSRTSALRERTRSAPAALLRTQSWSEAAALYQRDLKRQLSSGVTTYYRAVSLM